MSFLAGTNIAVDVGEQVCCDFVIQDSLERDVIISVITTIRVPREQWSVLYQVVHREATYVSVTDATPAATVNRLSIKHVLHPGGDHRSVDLATAREIEDLTQVVTSKQESAVAGYVLWNNLLLSCGVIVEMHREQCTEEFTCSMQTT